jgi:hypothetical protein
MERSVASFDPLNGQGDAHRPREVAEGSDYRALVVSHPL